MMATAAANVATAGGLLRAMARAPAAAAATRRGMASGRNYYVKDASNAAPRLSEEVKDLVRNQRDQHNIHEWRRQPGIADPVVLDMQPDDDKDYDQMPDVVYYPHKGDEFHKRSAGYEPAKVLLVKRVKTLRGEPWYHKETCERLGLGKYSHPDRYAVVPNVPSMSVKLYTIKHLVEIIPVRFPEGVPGGEDFDPKACRISHNGEFICHPRLQQDARTLQPDREMLVTREQWEKEARKHWLRPWNNLFGNPHYHRDTRFTHPEKKSRATDPLYGKRFSKESQ